MSLPVAGPAKPRRNYGRGRAMTLGFVYVLFVIHFVHCKLAGKTLAPLELNEVLHVLYNFINLLRIPTELEFAIIGTVILLGVVADELIKRFVARRSR